jgi:PAS domain S-box-containing protein
MGVRGRKEASHDAAVEYRAVFEAAPDGIVLVEPDGAIVDVNPCALRMFGYERDEIVGQAVEMLVPREMRRNHLEHRHRYMEAPRARPMAVGMELRGVRKDGSEFPVEISLSPVTEARGGYVISIVRDLTERRALQAFGAGAVRAAEEERQRIARELHDEVGQALTAVVLQLDRVARRAGPEREDGVAEARETVRASLEEVRGIVRRLRPEALDDLGLRSALAALTNDVARRTGVRVERRIAPDLPVLDPEEELVVYRVAQEALTNVVRHARTDAARVTLIARDTEIELLVHDDGVGVDQHTVEESSGGIRGMRERALLIGSRLEVVAAEAGGTDVRLHVPI